MSGLSKIKKKGEGSGRGLKAVKEWNCLRKRVKKKRKNLQASKAKQHEVIQNEGLLPSPEKKKSGGGVNSVDGGTLSRGES